MWRVALVAWVVAGCGSTPELTCALLADPSSCFAQQAAALAACIPLRATPGVLSSDGTTCTFADGVHLEFYSPLPRTDLYSAVGLTMTAYSADGSKCGSLYYDESSEGTVISVNNAASWNGFEPNVKLYCRSETYEGSYTALQTCGPSVDLSLSASSGSVTLRAPAPMPLFTCQ